MIDRWVKLKTAKWQKYHEKKAHAHTNDIGWQATQKCRHLNRVERGKKFIDFFIVNDIYGKLAQINNMRCSNMQQYKRAEREEEENRMEICEIPNGRPFR